MAYAKAGSMMADETYRDKNGVAWTFITTDAGKILATESATSRLTYKNPRDQVALTRPLLVGLVELFATQNKDDIAITVDVTERADAKQGVDNPASKGGSWIALLVLLGIAFLVDKPRSRR